MQGLEGSGYFGLVTKVEGWGQPMTVGQSSRQPYFSCLTRGLRMNRGENWSYVDIFLRQAQAHIFFSLHAIVLSSLLHVLMGTRNPEDS